uniref:phosphoserine phosphatase n=1 Tax=Ditylum brightwellii TaxID=49249 RepID=A0A6U4AII0_9STRA|mmetsp:Transcript_11176/g.16651  ORF Transcript_11176/g.16651 Transcript_11176/m.16651 type:complete len:333 (+) Transcript_11176:148-1146(+)
MRSTATATRALHFVGQRFFSMKNNNSMIPPAFVQEYSQATRRTSRAAYSSLTRSNSYFLNGSVTATSRNFSAASTDGSFSLPSGADILETFGPEKSSAFEGNDVSTAMEMLSRADAVCFDVDSTVIQEEGIDVLADSLGRGEEVAAWTAKAMDGDTKFEDALAARLSIIQPSINDIKKCLEENPLQLSPGVDTLIKSLMERGTDVYLVSGGFRIMIEPLAEKLGLPKENIVANTILFDEDGNYAGFDSNEPTSADLGKPKALTQIKEANGYECMIMVGDGATDAQAKPPAAAFVGFGGVAVRDAVRAKACWFVRDFEDMITVVNKFPHNSPN